MSDASPIPREVFQAFEAVPAEKRKTLLEVREMILEVARSRSDIGPIEETLRWGEPAYVSSLKRTGSTIRLAIEKGSGQPALFFNCRTTLVEEFRQQFGTSLRYVKNRAILLDQDPASTAGALKICIEAALRYHMRG